MVAWVGNPSGPSGHLPCKAEEFSSGRTSNGLQCIYTLRGIILCKMNKIAYLPKSVYLSEETEEGMPRDTGMPSSSKKTSIAFGSAGIPVMPLSPASS